MTCIVFKSDKAFNHLVKHGYVYTLRRYAKVGYKCLKRDRYGKSVGLVKVEYIGTVVKLDTYFVNVNNKLIPLEQFAKHSGFNSLVEWLSEFRRLTGVFNPVNAKLLKVSLVRLFE